MSEPVFDDTTERMYAQFPAHFRRADISNNYSLKRLLAAGGGELGNIENTLTAIDYTPPDDGGVNSKSAMVDGSIAPAAWLPWIGQVMGVQGTVFPTEASRGRVVMAAAGYRAGTRRAIGAVVQGVLVGTKYVRVYSRSNASGINSGGPWDLLIITRASETLKNVIPVDIATTSNATRLVFNTNAQTQNDIAAPSFYNARALQIRTDPASSTTSLSVTLPDIAVTANDPYRFMASIQAPYWTSIANNFTPVITLQWKNSSGTVLRTDTPALMDADGYSVTAVAKATKQQLIAVAPSNTPAATTTLTATITISGANKQWFNIGEFGLRRESNNIWVPQTADPVATVINAGAKPAGFNLYTKTFESTWDSVQTAYPTWDAAEGKTWTTIEETGIGS